MQPRELAKRIKSKLARVPVPVNRPELKQAICKKVLSGHNCCI